MVQEGSVRERVQFAPMCAQVSDSIRSDLPFNKR